MSQVPAVRGRRRSICLLLLVARTSVEASSSSASPRVSLYPGRRGFPKDDQDFVGTSTVAGMGREFDIFDSTRGGSGPEIGVAGSSVGGDNSNYPTYPTRITPSSTRRTGGRSYGNSRRSSSSFFQPVQEWWTSNISPNIKSWPKIQCIVEPTTTLKIRKTFRPLKTVVRLGADFNTQLGVWQFKSSWEDEIIGGKITLAGRELQLTKSWQLSVGAVEDLVTRLRFRAAVDLQTWKAYARVGFRTERLRPINVMEGFTIWKQVPLDGTKGHVKLEVKANLALPEPEIEYSTETQRSLVGMGDIEINIEELNLLLDY